MGWERAEKKEMMNASLPKKGKDRGSEGIRAQLGGGKKQGKKKTEEEDPLADIKERKEH